MQDYLRLLEEHLAAINKSLKGWEEGQFDPTPYGFSKNLCSRKRVNPSFFVTIIISHIVPENLLEVVQGI